MDDSGNSGRTVEDDLVRQFEQRWRSGDQPRIADALPPRDHPRWTRLLLKLITLDQEYRWKSGERVTVEDYLDQWRELQGDDEILLELIEAECVTRGLMGAGPTREELESRFPDLSHRIDTAALAGELEETKTFSGSSVVRATNVNQGPLAPGQQLGKYKIVRLVGRGGMGWVYEARHTKLTRSVALKVPELPPDADTTLLDRFVREGQAAAQIDHPHVCPIYDADEIDSHHFITMKLVSGEPLSKTFHRGPLSGEEAACLTEKIASALEASHLAGVIHRDVKPANVMIDESGEPVLMDFGLAQRIEHDLPAREGATRAEHGKPSQHSLAGSLVGTVPYMAPEQLAGKVTNEQSDIYSLGVLLYQALTGKHPFEGPVPKLVSDIMNFEPPKPRELKPGLDRDLERICLTAISKSPDERFRSAGEMAHALRAYLAKTSKRPWQRGGAWWFTGIGASAALLVLTAIFLRPGEHASTTEPADPRLPEVEPAGEPSGPPRAGPIIYEISAYEVPRTAHAADIADLDNDGQLDIVCGLSRLPGDEETNYVHWGRGRRQFRLERGFGDGAAPCGAKIADLTGDGLRDLLFLHEVGDFPSQLFVNEGDGFQRRSIELAPCGPYGGNGCWGLALGDLNGDGHLDAVSGRRMGYLYKSINDGNGNFETSRFGDEGVHDGIAIADLDGDGHLDVADAGPIGGWTGPFAIYWNDGSGVFAERTLLHEAGEKFSISLGDIDGDEDWDIAVGISYPENGAIYRNEGERQFVLHAKFPSHPSMVLADLDGDAQAELVAGGEQGNAPQPARTLHIYWDCVGEPEGRVDRYLIPSASEFLPMKCLVVEDIDGDGTQDIFSGATEGFNHILWGRERGFSTDVIQVAAGQRIYNFGTDRSGNFQICFYGPARGTICTSSREGQDWQQPKVVGELAALRGDSHSFAVGADGEVRVAFRGDPVSDECALKYAEVSPRLVIQTVPGAVKKELVKDQGYCPSLYLSDGDQPHIAHWCYQGIPNHTLLYSRRDATGTWQTESTGVEISPETLRIDSLGYPHVVGKDWATAQVAYVHKDDVGWHKQLLPCPSVAPKLALTPQAHPRIVAAHGGKVFYFAENWEKELVANAGLASPLCSLAIDSTGRPHVALMCRQAKQYVLKYLVRDSRGVWNRRRVQATPLDRPWQSIRIALAGDKPVIAYTDGETVYCATWNHAM